MTLVDILKILLSYEDDEVEHPLQNLLYKMFIIGRHVCFILAVVFTVVAVITNSQNNTRQVPPLRPFFNEDTWVDDFYAGELYYAILKAAKYDVIFLMLYAPWDADSQNARSEFETTCRFFHKKVYCAAVNCWQANGGCKVLFENIAVYPLFLLDLRSVPSIKYNGEYISSHMIQFVSDAMKPLKRVHSLEEFNSEKTVCDAMTMSYLPGYKWYNRYYMASVRYLEYDPRHDVCWAFVTSSELADELGLSLNTIKLYLWNETKTYTGLFKDREITKWVLNNIHYLTQWVFFKNSRSNLVSELLEQNPSVILITPRNIFLENIPAYLLFKEAVIEYKNCFEIISFLHQLPFLEKKRSELKHDFHQWENICRERFDYGDEAYHLFGKCNYKMKYPSQGFDNFTENTYTCKPYTSRINFGKDPLNDPRSPENLVLYHIREQCRKMNLLKKMYESDSLKWAENSYTDSTPSNLCTLNRTFTFFAVDSLLYDHFPKALGINLELFDDRTAVVMVNSQAEEIYVLKEPLTNKNQILEFMVNASYQWVPRWLKSTNDHDLYIHRYREPSNLLPHDFNVIDLNSDDFRSVVFNSTQYVVLYHYSPYCGYCQVSAHVFLTVAHKMKNFRNLLFARIDSENNDLPWHFSPLTYPTIMIFPAKNKGESNVFPIDEELTVENIIDFILENVDVDTKFIYMMAECEDEKKERNASLTVYRECIDHVKSHCLQLINRYVKRYTNLDTNISDEADIIYKLIKMLKSIYLRIEENT